MLLVIPLFPLLIIIASLRARRRHHGADRWCITLTGWSYTARQLRAQALSLRNRDFLDAAKVRGERPLYIIASRSSPR